MYDTYRGCTMLYSQLYFCLQRIFTLFFLQNSGHELFCILLQVISVTAGANQNQNRAWLEKMKEQKSQEKINSGGGGSRSCGLQQRAVLCSVPPVCTQSYVLHVHAYKQIYTHTYTYTNSYTYTHTDTHIHT